jgi:peroxiredoxin
VTRRGLWLAPAAFLLSAAAAEIPRPAPELELSLPGGQVWKLSQQKGKVVFVEFLLTHCPGCQQAARILSKIQLQYGSAVSVVGVAINADASKGIAGFRANYATAFPVGLRDNSTAHAFLQVPIMSSLMMPSVAIIDKKGVIREQHLGQDMAFWNNEEKLMHEAVQKYMAEGQTPAKKAPGKGAAKKSK